MNIEQFVKELNSLIQEKKSLEKVETDFIRLTSKHNYLMAWLTEKHPDVLKEYNEKLVNDLY